MCSFLQTESRFGHYTSRAIDLGLQRTESCEHDWAVCRAGNLRQRKGSSKQRSLSGGCTRKGHQIHCCTPGDSLAMTISHSHHHRISRKNTTCRNQPAFSGNERIEMEWSGHQMTQIAFKNTAIARLSKLTFSSANRSLIWGSNMVPSGNLSMVKEIMSELISWDLEVRILPVTISFWALWIHQTENPNRQFGFLVVFFSLASLNTNTYLDLGNKSLKVV